MKPSRTPIIPMTGPPRHHVDWGIWLLGRGGRVVGVEWRNNERSMIRVSESGCLYRKMSNGAVIISDDSTTSSLFQSLPNVLFFCLSYFPHNFLFVTSPTQTCSPTILLHYYYVWLLAWFIKTSSPWHVHTPQQEQLCPSNSSQYR